MQSSPDQIRTIVLERGGCATCPHYSITFSWDGRATYHGVAAADMIGDYSTTADYSSLADWIDSEKLDGLAGVYGKNSVDAASMKLTIARSKSTAVIDARELSAAPLEAFGAAAVLDGYVEAPWWRPAGPLDAYIGWFLDDSKPGVLRRLNIYPHGVAIAHVDPVTYRSSPCSADGLALSGGGYEVVIDPLTRLAKFRTYSDPTILAHLRVQSGAIAITGGDAAGTYRRISERDIDKAVDKLSRAARAKCASATPQPPAPGMLGTTNVQMWLKQSSTPIDSVMLTRTFCIPVCSAFAVTYRSDGTASFYGNYYVDPIGANVGHVDFQRIAAWLDSHYIDRFQGQVGKRTIDGRITRIRVARSDRQTDFEFLGGEAEDFPQGALWITIALEGFARQVHWSPVNEIDRFAGWYLTDASGGQFRHAYLEGQGGGYLAGAIAVESQDRCARDGIREVSKKIGLRIRNGALEAIWIADEVGPDQVSAWANSTRDSESLGTRAIVASTPDGFVINDGDRPIALRHVSVATALGASALYNARYGSSGATRPSDCPAL